VKTKFCIQPIHIVVCGVEITTPEINQNSAAINAKSEGLKEYSLELTVEQN